MRKAVQVLVRRDAGKYLAECLEYPVTAESEFLDDVLSGIENRLREYLEERGAWEPEGIVLFVSTYLGRFHNL